MSVSQSPTEQSTEQSHADSLAPQAKVRLPKMLAGTMVSTDLDRARVFYEQAFGFECVQHAEDRLLIRDRYAKAAMNHGSDDFFVIDVKQVAEILTPHHMCNHWGFDVDSISEVDRINAVFKERQEEFGLTKIMPITRAHGAYGFYSIDRDQNWWEVQFPEHGYDNAGMFCRGDSMDRAITSGGTLTSKAKRIKPDCSSEYILGDGDLSHGTMKAIELEQERGLLRDVFGLNTVQHISKAMLFAGTSHAIGGVANFAVVSLGIPVPNSVPMHSDVRWILSVADADELRIVRDRALASGTHSGEITVGEILESSSETSCLIGDAEGNWFELTTKGAKDYQAIFNGFSA
jgi:catechol 2,3-dioxygenase-like lactoylglutathione lyase family enzyme